MSDSTNPAPAPAPALATIAENVPKSGKKKAPAKPKAKADKKILVKDKKPKQAKVPKNSALGPSGPMPPSILLSDIDPSKSALENLQNLYKGGKITEEDCAEFLADLIDDLDDNIGK